MGASTLVLSDEAHHIYSPGDVTLKKWKAFIASPAYGFRYHVGLSGTCYVGNDYFSDVVHRYSIRDAINDRWVKDVFYVSKDESNTDDERFQKLLHQHETNRNMYKPLKPLTIAVTAIAAPAAPSAARLSPIALAGNVPSGFHATNMRIATAASARPARPPQKTMSRLSVRNCRTI